MKLVRVIACLATVAATLVTGPDASATPVGRLCGFTSITDPTVQNGQTQIGQINGGPVTDDTDSAAVIYLICTIQVGAANSTHADSRNDAAVVSGFGAHVAVATGPVSYVSPEGQPVYLCTEVWVGSPFNPDKYYRDASTSMWVENPGPLLLADVPCAEAISQEISPDPSQPVLDLRVIDETLRTPESVICLALAPFFPPHGDVGIFWDCPPYGG